MGRGSKKPELIVRRECTNERPLLDLFADAYRVYFDEKQRMKSSERTFDTNESVGYNGADDEKEEGNHNGPAA